MMKKKLKKIFNLYNLAILICVVVIIGSLIIIIKPNFSGMFKKKTAVTSDNGVKIVSNDNNGGEISEKDARRLAKKQFKELDEKVKEEELEVLKIERNGEEYYYISSAKNTLEIKIKTGEITRINSVKVGK